MKDIVEGARKLVPLLSALDDHAIVSRTDPAGVITYVNARFCKVSGYTKDELVGKTHSVLKSGIHDADFYCDLWKTITAGRTWRGNLCNRSKGGELYWVESTITPILDQGEIAEFVSVRTEITDIVRKTEAIEHQRSVLEKVMLSVEFILFRESLLTGEWYQRPEDRLGSYVFDALRLKSDLVVKQHRERLDLAREHLGLEVKVQLEFGPDDLEWFAFKYLSVIHDESFESPEILVLARRVEEFESALLVARNAVEQMNLAEQRRNKIYGTIAHELRTPVAALQMLCELSNTEFSKNQKHIKGILGDLIATIDEMRLVTNPEYEKPLNLESVGLIELNRQISNAAIPIASAGHFRFELLNTLPLVLSNIEINTDLFRIRVAVINLVRNAVLHSRGCNVWVSNSLRSLETGELYLEWHTSDDGIGLGDASAQGTELSRPGEGVVEGQGLQIARKLVAELNGTLSYLPRSKGSEFTISVPIDPAIFDSTQPLRFEQSLPEPHQTDIPSDLRILLVEDDAMIRLLSQQLLTKLGMDVVVAVDGEDGLKKFDDNFDLVLTDYFMPVMNGVEMIDNIRAKNRSVPIVGVTAATIGSQREEMKMAGATNAIAKPLTAASFKAEVMSLIEKGLIVGRDR